MFLSLLMACTPDGSGGKNNQQVVDSDPGLVDSEVQDLGCQGDIGLEAGMCAPDFSLVSANGGQVVLSELAGERVVVLGSASW